MAKKSLRAYWPSDGVASVLPGAEDADEGVIEGADVVVRESPASWFAGGAL